MIKIPLSERPRERFIASGGDSLAVSELLAILIGHGTKGRSALDLADELLSYFGGLAPLLESSLQELMQIKGIGKAKAIQLQAAFSLARRAAILRETLAESPLIDTSLAAYRAIQDLFYGCQTEMVALLFLNTRLQLFHKEVIGVGTLTEVLIHPREVFYHAIRRRAHSIILAHNHPSGDPTPSVADLQVTHLLFSMGRLMEIHLVDHIILGRSCYHSLKDHNQLTSSL